MARTAELENSARAAPILDYLGVERGDPAAIQGHDVVYRCEAAPSWVDLNGHVNVNLYGIVFDLASDLLNQHLGFTDAYIGETGQSIFTAESHICYLAEAFEGERLAVQARVYDFDEKRLHHYLEMRGPKDDRLIAISEMMLLHFDLKAGRVGPWHPQIRERITSAHRAHQALNTPSHAGRTIGIRGKG